MNYITFAGVSSSDYKIGISGSGTYGAPERDIETVSVPGRSGDLYIDNNRFKNITVTYPAFISSDFGKRFGGFRAFMMSQKGYQRLEDTYHPDEYRLAIFTGPMDPDVKVLNRSGEFDISFNCKPQRWLKSGEEPITLTASGSIFNPTLFDAKPLLRLYGTGTITIGNFGITVSSASTYTDIDCEIMEAYKGSTNCNGNISLTGSDFPKISPGANTVTISGFSSVVIYPRWWTL